MILSDSHRYVFIELPRTGSTAIARELVEHYDGRSILTKHATYRDFLRNANKSQRDYFVFSCIRNPLDEAVSLYFKAKTDPDQSFSRLRNAPLRTRIVHGNRYRRHAFATGSNGCFDAYLRRFYKLPYSSWAILAHKHFDYVIRFESLEADFAAVLDRLGLQQVRPLPLVNATAARDRDYVEYYKPSTERRATFVFGPFMEKWGYALPDHWRSREVSHFSRAMYRLVNIPRRVYWKHLRRFAYRFAASPRRASA